MLSALWTGQTGLSAQDKQLGVVSNNLANVLQFRELRALKYFIEPPKTKLPDRSFCPG